MTKQLNKLFYSWFYLGYSPKASGTIASVGAIPLCIMLNQYQSHFMKISFIIGFTLLAIISAAAEQEESQKRDPSHIVSDEVAGMLISTYFVTKDFTFNQTHFIQYGYAFLLFRLFDIWKPTPIRILDKKSKTSQTAFHRGIYIILDDVLAGIFACAVYALTLYIFWKYYHHSSI